MNFNDEFPEYSAIAEHIRRADAQNSVYFAHRFADALIGAARFVKRLAPASLRRNPAASIR
jgi:hypothetical protein